ncbi:solute carrier family 35 member G1-like isoform X2 [Tachypleus tridentatus]
MFKLIPSMNPLEIATCMSVIQTSIFSSVIIQTREPLCGAPAERRVLLVRAVSGVLACNLSFYSLRFIPLADVTIILSSTPVFVNIFACMFLKEPCGWFHVATVITTMTGIFLITKPSFIFGKIQKNCEVDNIIIGSILAFGSCLAISVIMIAVRKLRSTNYATINLTFSILLIIVNSAILIITGDWSFPSCGKEGLLLSLMGVLVTFGQFFQTAALKLEEAGLISISRTFDIVIAFIFQVTLLDEEILWTSVLGAVLICSGVGLLGWKKWKG